MEIIPFTFMGKRVDDNSWMIGYSIQQFPESSRVKIDKFGDSAWILPDTVCVSSGFKTINDEMIFSKMIVSFNDSNYKYVVKFWNGAFYLFHTEQKTFDGKPYCWGLLSRAFDSDMIKTLGDLKIVGNEIDNPELMKKY